MHFESFITHKTNSNIHFMIYSKMHFESFITHKADRLYVKHPHFECKNLCKKNVPYTHKMMV